MYTNRFKFCEQLQLSSIINKLFFLFSFRKIMGCFACNYVGSVKIGPTQQIVPSQKNLGNEQRRIIYMLGNNQSASNHDEAADELISKHFPEIYELRETDPERFNPGMVGTCRIPSLFITEIPQIAAPEKLRAISKEKIMPPNIRGKERYKVECR